jgi:hypothetical protein
MAPPIRIVCGTRSCRALFSCATALGRSLSLFGPSPFLQMQIFDNNFMGLPKIYNKAIDDAERNPALLMFIHDDVHICDFFWMDRIYDAVRRFDIYWQGTVEESPDRSGGRSRAQTGPETARNFSVGPLGMARAFVATRLVYSVLRNRNASSWTACC